MTVPPIIHQTWKTAEVPAAFAAMQASWRAHHPGWRYRLWTDEDLLRLVERRFPRLRAIYLGYRNPISRPDLARYLLLFAFGGVYADLDSECLRPVGPLIAGVACAVGLEPAAHLALDVVAERGFTRLLGPSFMASAPGHPFWRHVIRAAVAARREPGPLDATGPFLLTRAYETFPDRAGVTLIPAARVHPVTREDCWEGRIRDPAFWAAATAEAFAVHHWAGTWFKGEPAPA